MTNKRDLGRNLIPLGEYQKPQFLFYDSESSQLYAIDGYNNNSQSIWIWGGIVLAVPILRRLSNTLLIHHTVLKLLSVILAIIVSFIISKFFRKKSLKTRKFIRSINLIIKIVISIPLHAGLIDWL